MKPSMFAVNTGIHLFMNFCNLVLTFSLHFCAVSFHRTWGTGELVCGFLYEDFVIPDLGTRTTAFLARAYTSSVLLYLKKWPWRLNHSDNVQKMRCSSVSSHGPRAKSTHFCVPSLRTGLSKHLRMPGKDCSERASRLLGHAVRYRGSAH